MSNDDRPSKPYRVGYRSPPVEHRFRPGQSGNPKGARKGRRKLGTVLDKLLHERIPIREGNTTTSLMSKREVILRGILNSAMKGDPRAWSKLLEVEERSGEFEKGYKHNAMKITFVTTDKSKKD